MIKKETVICPACGEMRSKDVTPSVQCQNSIGAVMTSYSGNFTPHTFLYMKTNFYDTEMITSGECTY